PALAIERGIDRPEDPRHRPEQRFVEERQRGPDLVERAGGDGPEIGRPPEQRDLLAQPAAGVAVLARRGERILEAGQLALDAAEREQQRPAAGLGGGGGGGRGG